MPKIDLEDTTYDQLTLLARAWEVTEAEAVDRLLGRFREADRRTAGPADKEEVEVPIHAIYRGVRSEGVYNRKTRRITLTEGPVHDTFHAPSPAAAAFVTTVNPHVSGSRNGWDFWIITETGDPLQTIR